MNEQSSFSSPLLKANSIEKLMTAPALLEFQQSLIPYLARQRWFGAKSRAIQTVRVTDWARLPGLDASLVFLEVTHDDGNRSVYLVPLAISNGEEATSIRARQPASIAAPVMTPKGAGIVHDALVLEGARQRLVELIETNGEIHTQKGVVQGRRSSAFATARGTGQLASRTGSSEQSNSSILYGSKLILKLFRRLEPGENPDTEIGRFLTETAHFSRIAPFLGEISLRSGHGEGTTVAMLQGLVANDGDGWQVTLNELAGFYGNVAGLAAPKDLVEHAGAHLSAAGLLGERTAEMHLALATPTENPAFRAEPFTSKELSADAVRIENQLALTLGALEQGQSGLTGTSADDAAVLVLSKRNELLARARAIASYTPAGFGQRIRIHGDYHLGQVLRSHGDYVILDFEGEPVKTLGQRRVKQSPLRDVAGMLRSFDYASYAALHAFAERRRGDVRNLEPWANLWQHAASKEFLKAYRARIEETNPQLTPQAGQAELLLNAYLLEKALYELIYELDNRPAWIRIPMAGILNLL